MVNYIKGLDISIIQGNINWQAVATAGYEFVVCRCGVGNNGIDANYKKNIFGAKAAGLKVAAYHFIFPLPSIASGDTRSPKWQANYHYNAAGGEIAAIDCEWPAPTDFSKWGCSPAQINQWMLDYFAEYARLDGGRKPLLYTYPDWANHVNFASQFKDYPLWIASYQAAPYIPKPWDDFVLWQNSGGNVAKLPGSGAPVDTDLAKDLSLWETDNNSVAQPSTIVNTVPVSSPPAPVEASQPVSPIPVVDNKKSAWDAIVQFLMAIGRVLLHIK